MDDDMLLPPKHVSPPCDGLVNGVHVSLDWPRRVSSSLPTAMAIFIISRKDNVYSYESCYGGNIGIVRRNPLGDLDNPLRIIQVQDQRDLRMTREFLQC